MHVLVRPPGPAFRHALSEHPDHGSIDPEHAIAEHALFVAALRSAGLDVVALPAEPDLPDATFVSDTLVALTPAHALDSRTASLVVARPASAARRPEVESVVAAAHACLVDEVREVAVEAPETLEGGDVVVAGDVLFVGLSRRTSEGGARMLAETAATLGYRPFLCPVEDRLHLATAVTAITPRLLIGTSAGFASLERAREPMARNPSPGVLDDFERIVLAESELGGANVLSVVGHCFLAAGNESAAVALRKRGLAVHELDLTEFALADGGPTCLVNLIP